MGANVYRTYGTNGLCITSGKKIIQINSLGPSDIYWHTHTYIYIYIYIFGVLVFYNTSPPRMFLSLDLLWAYRIQHGANGPLYVTSNYSTWIFCRGVSGFATDCRLVSWIKHLPPACWSTFWKSNLKQQLGCRFDIMDNYSYFFVCFDICNYICLDTSDHFSVLSS